jgi:hypothetical protein
MLPLPETGPGEKIPSQPASIVTEMSARVKVRAIYKSLIGLGPCETSLYGSRLLPDRALHPREDVAAQKMRLKV